MDAAKRTTSSLQPTRTRATDGQHRPRLGRVLSAGILVASILVPGSASAAIEATQIAAGDDQNCAINSAGTVTCWGSNANGKATPWISSDPYVQVAAGADHTCGLTSTGEVSCWGLNTYGQAPNIGASVGVGPLIQITAGWKHSCGLIWFPGTRGVQCWGDDSDGQDVDKAGAFIQVSSGDSHNCALLDTGAIDCWGDDSSGQAVDQVGPYTQVSAGGTHTCALTTTRAADCWGDDSFGQPTSDQPGPYIQLSSGVSHTCGLTPTGAVDCWGDDTSGKGTDQPGPYVQVTAGRFHTCALTAAGAAECWGSDSVGQGTDVAGPFRAIAATTLSIKAPSRARAGSRITVKGVLSSADPMCAAFRDVSLKLAGKKVPPVRTEGNGAYRFTARLSKSGSAQVFVQGTPGCGASKSSKRAVRVS